MEATDNSSIKKKAIGSVQEGEEITQKEKTGGKEPRKCYIVAKTKANLRTAKKKDEKHYNGSSSSSDLLPR